MNSCSVKNLSATSAVVVSAVAGAFLVFISCMVTRLAGIDIWDEVLAKVARLSGVAPLHVVLHEGLDLGFDRKPVANHLVEVVARHVFGRFAHDLLGLIEIGLVVI